MLATSESSVCAGTVWEHERVLISVFRYFRAVYCARHVITLSHNKARKHSVRTEHEFGLFQHLRSACVAQIGGVPSHAGVSGCTGAACAEPRTVLRQAQNS